MAGAGERQRRVDGRSSRAMAAISRRQVTRLLAAALLATALPSGGVAPAPALAEPIALPPTDWRSTLERDHPLAGKLWSVPRRLVQPLELLAREIVFEDFVLLGEVHDNPDHHRLRAWAIECAARVWRRDPARQIPAAVFEHIRADQSERISDPGGAPHVFRDARALLERLEWAKSGWPESELFAPLFQAVADAAMPTFAGDAARGEVRDLARAGASSLPAERRAALGLDRPLPAPLQEDLLAELVDSHCGVMPKTAFAGMADAQRYRDAVLARRMADAAAGQGAAILFAGNGHVRRDRGVPLYLRQMVPGRKIITVLFLEVVPGRTDPSAYVPASSDGSLPADFVVFTPAAARADPCEAMRAMKPGRAPQ